MKKFILMVGFMSAVAQAATVSVSSFKGTVYAPGEATLAFSGVSAAQDVWVAWDDVDKGDDMSAWTANERTEFLPPAATESLPDAKVDVHAPKSRSTGTR